jgi:uncharacterized protein
MNLKLTLIALIGILLISTADSNAQTTSAAFSASQLKAAEQLLIATGINNQFGGIVDNMISSSSAQIPEAQRGEFINVMKRFMVKYYSWDALKVEFAKMYAAEYTEDELNQLTAFYNSPLGKKVGAKTPVLMQKGMALGQKTIADHRPELEQMMQDAFAKKETPAKQ